MSPLIISPVLKRQSPDFSGPWRPVPGFDVRTPPNQSVGFAFCLHASRTVLRGAGTCSATSSIS